MARGWSDSTYQWRRHQVSCNPRDIVSKKAPRNRLCPELSELTCSYLREAAEQSKQGRRCGISRLARPVIEHIMSSAYCNLWLSKMKSVISTGTINATVIPMRPLILSDGGEVVRREISNQARQELRDSANEPDPRKGRKWEQPDVPLHQSLLSLSSLSKKKKKISNTRPWSPPM